MKNYLFLCLLLFCMSTSAQTDTAKIDTSIAYVRYNPEVAKYAVYAREPRRKAIWNYLDSNGMKGLHVRDRALFAPFLLFDKKEDAEARAIAYIAIYRRQYRAALLKEYDYLARGFQ